MINYSTVADQKMLNSGSLVVKLNFIHTGCFRVCSGGGVGGEENFRCLKLWSFTSQTFGLRGIFARSSYFIQVYFLSVLLSFLYFFLFTLFWLFYCFCCCCCCCFISYFFLFAANFSVFLLISALEQRGGGFFGLRGEGRGGGRDIRLITSHTERTKFFIARKKAASFRDTLVRRKSLGSWDLSFQNFFTKGRFQVIPQ